MERLDCVIAGAGVVGLAIAREMALSGRTVIVLEAQAEIGMETSSRNSEVIHAGIYYAKDSLKSNACIEGKKKLYHYCEERKINFKNCGKLIAATDDTQKQQLLKIQARAAACGMKDLHIIDQRQIYDMEPSLNAIAALWSPTTGIIDSHNYMISLQTDLEASGGMVVFNSFIQSGNLKGDNIELTLNGGYTFQCKTLINSAGLGAQTLCQSLTGFPASMIPRQYLAKGSYFSLSGKCPFSHLIYPVPVPGGLGTHLTLDLAGQGRFGPNVKWVDSIDYNVDPSEAEAFYSDIRTYWPDLEDGQLQPGYSGVRPKIVPKGAAAGDFIIQGPQAHGIDGLVNLFGIESPGLTASLSLAERVAAELH